MIDDKTISTIERIEERLKEMESVVKALDQAIECKRRLRSIPKPPV
jgi:hypothetical protein